MQDDTTAYVGVRSRAQVGYSVSPAWYTSGWGGRCSPKEMGRKEISAASSQMPAMEPAATFLVTQRPYLRQTNKLLLLRHQRHHKMLPFVAEFHLNMTVSLWPANLDVSSKLVFNFLHHKVLKEWCKAVNPKLSGRQRNGDRNIEVLGLKLSESPNPELPTDEIFCILPKKSGSVSNNSVFQIS